MLLFIPGSLRIAKNSLQLSKFNPCGAICRRVFQKFLIKLSASVKLTQLQLELDVFAEKLVFRRFSDGNSENAASICQIFLTNFEVSKMQPNFRKCELKVSCIKIFIIYMFIK